MMCNRRQNLQKLQIVNTNHIKRDGLGKFAKIANFPETPDSTHLKGSNLQKLQIRTKMSKIAKIADFDKM